LRAYGRRTRPTRSVDARPRCGGHHPTPQAARSGGLGRSSALARSTAHAAARRLGQPGLTVSRDRMSEFFHPEGREWGRAPARVTPRPAAGPRSEEEAPAAGRRFQKRRQGDLTAGRLAPAAQRDGDGVNPAGRVGWANPPLAPRLDTGLSGYRR